MRNVDIEKHLGKALAEADCTEEQVRTIAEVFGRSAYPDKVRHIYGNVWMELDEETGKGHWTREVVEKRTTKNGWATATKNLIIKQWEKNIES